MTMTMDILRFMAGRGQADFTQVSVAIERDLDRVRFAMHTLKTEGFIEPVIPAGKKLACAYRITSAGYERSKYTPKTRKQGDIQAKERAEQRAKARFKAEEEARERRTSRVLAAVEQQERQKLLAVQARSTVALAMRDRHPLDLAWGAPA